MPLELEEIPLQQQFEEIISTEDKLAIQEFLNDQNISDVAELIYENPDYETQIIAHLSIHRAASVFKILDINEQKRIIKNLPAFKSAELLNELPPDDRVSFLEELPNSTVRELIKTLDPEERKITLELLGYPENSVGRLMTPDYVYVYEDNSVTEVIDTIRRAGHKVLFFSSFEKYLRLFRAQFEEVGHAYAWLTGETTQTQRKQAVDRFTTDPTVQAFLITTKAGGVGLNLTAADYVFVLDPWWNPFVEDQAIARAHRIGQTEKVVAVKFIAKDTIEEKILKMQEKKAALAGEILASGDGMAFTREELGELLR